MQLLLIACFTAALANFAAALSYNQSVADIVTSSFTTSTVVRSEPLPSQSATTGGRGDEVIALSEEPGSNSSLSMAASMLSYTCYAESKTNADDCQAVIDSIRSLNADLYLTKDECRGYTHGTCIAKICQKGDLETLCTTSWLADRLASPLMANCMKNGENGVLADCTDFMGDCGHNRIWLSNL
ncbi:hypothetical protein JX266_007330 [Neoarthrinium moseri]|nr:hypothetical protein JX266_007330 [Neoarthrinium moseri]